MNRFDAELTALENEIARYISGEGDANDGLAEEIGLTRCLVRLLHPQIADLSIDHPRRLRILDTLRCVSGGLFAVLQVCDPVSLPVERARAMRERLRSLARWTDDPGDLDTISTLGRRLYRLRCRIVGAGM